MNLINWSLMVGASIMLCSCAKDLRPIELSGSLEMQVGDSGLQKPRRFKVATQIEKGADMAWSCLGYNLSFTAGPDGYDSRLQRSKSFSYFELKKGELGYSQCTFHGAISECWEKYDKYIDVFTTDRAEVILIREDIPNDCCPSFNYTLISQDEGDFTYRYLSWPHDSSNYNVMTDPDGNEVVIFDGPVFTQPKDFKKLSVDGVLFDDGSYMKWSEMKTQKNPTVPG